jgi:hypothetical protein
MRIMATDAQIEANRANAQRSTGPRTEAGKTSASRNATKFGLFSRHLLLPGEDEEEFIAFRDGLIARLAPADALERMFVERIVAAGWRLQRALEGEARLFADWRRSPGFDEAADVLTAQCPMQDLDRLQKHIVSLERSMDRALAELKRIQESRPEPGSDVEKPICENEPNSAPASPEVESSARIEIVKTNPIPIGKVKEEARETAICENEPNLRSGSAVDPGGGAFPAPTPDPS